MNESRYIAKHVINLPKSGIRDFFEIVSKMKDVISLGSVPTNLYLCAAAYQTANGGAIRGATARWI